MPRETQASEPVAAASSGGTLRPRRVISSGALFEDGREIVILHADDEYRLRITKTGKLILTK